MNNLKQLPLLLVSIYLMLSVHQINAQTYLSGGIYQNTTLTKAGSPYIVVGNLVVFEGVKFIINPGTVIRFRNGSKLEFRTGSLIEAIGEMNDSILFIADTNVIKKDIWSGIYFKGFIARAVFSYCRFSGANKAIQYNIPGSKNFHIYFNHCAFLSNTDGYNENSGYFSSDDFTDPTQASFTACLFANNTNGVSSISGLQTYSKVKSFHQCLFINNTYGLFNVSKDSLYQCSFIGNNWGIKNISNSIVSECLFDSNLIAISYLFGISPDSFSNLVIYRNTIRRSVIGIDNVLCRIRIIGNTFENDSFGLNIMTFDPNTKISCNTFCNNYKYNIVYMPLETINLGGNYWCSMDSSVIASKILDGHFNINYGLASFMPIDTQHCYRFVGLTESVSKIPEFNCYPNPVKDILSIQPSLDHAAYTVALYNLNGACVVHLTQSGVLQLDMQDLPSGMYLLQIAVDGRIIRKKIFKE